VEVELPGLSLSQVVLDVSPDMLSLDTTDASLLCLRCVHVRDRAAGLQRYSCGRKARVWHGATENGP
jgi:hypothetical protein